MQIMLREYLPIFKNSAVNFQERYITLNVTPPGQVLRISEIAFGNCHFSLII